MAQTVVMPNGDVFKMHRELLDVTSVHRPDVGWRHVDDRGHVHQWFADGHPADAYRPEKRHSVPSLTYVHDEWGYYEDGERYSIGHHECRECGEHIEPRYTADSTKQYIAGLTHCYINDVSVTREEFQQRYEAAEKQHRRGQ